ncbi:hypothetical protein Aperf_G00000000409 [Anoplocephala perfoliata]
MAAEVDPKYIDLQACCACLGFVDENVYKVDVDAPASIRLILRYLRYESTSCDIRRELGKMKILTSDLIPLLKVSKSDPILFDLAVRLMVSLTQPAIVCFRNEIPSDRDLYAAFLKVDSILKSYKQAFADEDLFRVLAESVECVFNKEWDERSEDDRLMIERILILIRNVLHISLDASIEHRSDEDVSIHDQLLWTIHLSGWDDLLLFLANAQDERGVFAFHILEIVSLMLREQTPEQLASAGINATDNDPTSQVLERCYLREQEEKKASLMQLNTRQNRFGGTFELVGTQSISSRPLIYHHDVTAPLRRNRLPNLDNTTSSSPTSTSAIEQVDLNFGKRMRRKAVNRKPLIEREYHRRSVLSVQLFLQKFCWEFLKNCYNLLMSSARSAILRRNTQANDETYYLWSMRFFMAFCRLYKFRPQYLSESLNVNVFNWVYTLAMGYREALLTGKRGGAKNQNALQCSRRLALAVSAYRQFLLCLQEMLKGSGNKVESYIEDDEPETLEVREQRLRTQKQVAESLMANIFYVAEYQDLSVCLLREYNEALQSKEYLAELVEETHLFISLLVAQSKNASTFIVSRRQKRRQRSENRRLQRAAHRQRQREMLAARKRLLERANETAEERTTRLTGLWTTVSTNLLSALAGNLEVPLGDELPELFDPAAMEGSEGIAIQLRSAIRLVHSSLHDNQAAKALGIARKMWDIWPESAPLINEKGADQEEEEEEEAAEENACSEKMRAVQMGLEPSKVAEYLAMREIFELDLAVAPNIILSFVLIVMQAEELEATETAIREENTWMEEDEENLIRPELADSDDDDDEERELDVVEREVAFDINSFLLRFAHPLIIRSLTLLLANYTLNPPSTNVHLVQLLHKIVVKQNLPGAVFQLRLFQVFQAIIHDPVVGKLEELKELLRFAKYILRKFFVAFERSRTVVVEALFHKSIREAAEAYAGYGTYEFGFVRIYLLKSWMSNMPIQELLNFRPKTSNWSPELDKELDQLFEAYRYDPVPKGEDLVDVLKRNLSDPEKTRRQIIMRLIHLGKVASAKNLKMITIRAGDEKGNHRNRSRRPAWTEKESEHLRELFLEYDGAESRFEDVLIELKLEYERKLKDYQQYEHREGGVEPTPQPPILRSREEVRKKLYDMGLARDFRDLGKIRRQRQKRVESRLELLAGDIYREKVGKVRSRRRRHERDSSSEYAFNPEEHEIPTSQMETSEKIEVAASDEKEIAIGATTTASSERLQKRSVYYDPEESSNEGSDEASTSSSQAESEDAENDLNSPSIVARENCQGVDLDETGGNLDDVDDENLRRRESTPVMSSQTEGDTVNGDFEGLRHSAKRRKVILEDDEDDDTARADGSGSNAAAVDDDDGIILEREINSVMKEIEGNVEDLATRSNRRRTRLLHSSDDNDD